MKEMAKIYNYDKDKPSHRSPVAKTDGEKKYTIQLQLSEKANNRLFELVERTEAGTAAQVVRDALRVYDILADEVENGGELFLKSKETGEIIRIKLF